MSTILLVNFTAGAAIVTDRLYNSLHHMDRDKLTSFLDSCCTPYQTVAYLRRVLVSAGYTELLERDVLPSPLPPQFFIVRDEMTLLAFSISTYDFAVALHATSDWPSLSLRWNYESEENGLQFIDLEHSAGQAFDANLLPPELRMCGTVVVRRDGKFEQKHVDSVRAIAVVPNTHEEKPAHNIFRALLGRQKLKPYVAGLCQCAESEIFEWQLRFISANKARFAGEKPEVVVAPRVKEKSLCFAMLESFLAAKSDKGIKILAIYGSGAKKADQRTSYYSDFFNSVFDSVLNDRDVNLARLRSLNLCGQADLKSDKLDKLHRKSDKCLYLLQSPKSDLADDMLANAIVTDIARSHKVDLVASCFAERAPSGIGPQTMERTGIRTAEIGQTSDRSKTDLGPSVAGLEQLIKLLTAVYNDYDPSKWQP
jgi:aspartyl aminopeptidase